MAESDHDDYGQRKVEEQLLWMAWNHGHPFHRDSSDVQVWREIIGDRRTEARVPYRALLQWASRIGADLVMLLRLILGGSACRSAELSTTDVTMGYRMLKIYGHESMKLTLAFIDARLPMLSSGSRRTTTSGLPSMNVAFPYCRIQI